MKVQTTSAGLRVCVVTTLMALAACTPRSAPEPAGSQEARQLVASAIDASNKPGVVPSALRTMVNPKGAGLFVYRPEGQEVLGVTRRFVWVVVDGHAFACNGPSKGVTPSLPWPREDLSRWNATGLSPYNAGEVLSIVFGDK